MRCLVCCLQPTTAVASALLAPFRGCGVCAARSLPRLQRLHYSLPSGVAAYILLAPFQGCSVALLAPFRGGGVAPLLLLARGCRHALPLMFGPGGRGHTAAFGLRGLGKRHLLLQPVGLLHTPIYFGSGRLSAVLDVVRGLGGSVARTGALMGCGDCRSTLT